MAASKSTTPSFFMRPPQLGDSAVMLEGRNSRLVHPFLFSDHIITLEEHQRWLEKKVTPGWGLANLIFIFLEGSKPLGTVNLTHLNEEHGRGEWGFYIWAADAPKGAGTTMLAAFLDELFLRQNLRKLCAQVLASNEKSLYLHRKLGFAEEGLLKKHVVKNGVAQDVVAFAMFDDVWRSKRKEFIAAIESVKFL